MVGNVGGGGAAPAVLVGAPSIELDEYRAITPVRSTPVRARSDGLTSDGLTGASPIPRGRPEGDLPATASCTFVVPAYNEEANILRLLDDFASRFDQLPVESKVIVVDDGSDDSTRELVSEYTGPIRVELVALPRNQGPGAAFRAGFAAALANCSDDGYIVTLEADTTSDLDALPEMFARVDAGADLVLAHWRMIDDQLAAAGFSARAPDTSFDEGSDSTPRRSRPSTACTAPRSFVLRRRGTAIDLIQESGFACKAELLAKLTSMGARVDEVTVDLDWSRRNGESKMPVARTMLAYWRMMSDSAHNRSPHEPRLGRDRRRRNPRHDRGVPARQAGVRVSVFERADDLGGLVGTFDFDGTDVDRFYHVVLPSDHRVIGLAKELGLGDTFRFRPTRSASTATDGCSR